MLLLSREHSVAEHGLAGHGGGEHHRVGLSGRSVADLRVKATALLEIISRDLPDLVCLLGFAAAVLDLPHRVKAPSAATLNEEPVTERMHRRQPRSLHTHERHQDQRNVIVMNMNRLLRLALGVPLDPAVERDAPRHIDVKSVHLDEVHCILIENRCNKCNHDREEGPHALTPSFYDVGVESQALHRARIQVSKVKADNEGQIPEQKVVPEYLHGCVYLTGGHLQAEVVGMSH